MLRSLPYKGTTSSRLARRSSNAIANSSDDDYAAVDLISDSEADEPDVEVAEEQAIILSAEGEYGDDEAQDVPRPIDYDDTSSWNGFDDVLGGNEAYFDDHMARSHAPDTLTQATTYNAVNCISSDDEPTRRVRFDLAEDSDGDEEDSMFPDIFLAQNDLDPTFRKAIESNDGNDDHVGSSEDGSYWDYREEERRQVAEMDEEEESGSSSGYETDEGETTEEDLPNVARFVPARSVLRHTTPTSVESEEEEVDIPVRQHFQVRGPRLGSWVHDQSRPFVAFDKFGKKLLVFNSGRRHSHADVSQTSPITESDLELHTLDQSPMISNSGNLMMSAMYGHTGNFMGALGPPEAFVPFTSISIDGTIVQDSLSSYDEDDISDSDMLNVSDFFNFGEESSDEAEGPEHQDDSTSTAAEAPFTPVPKKTTSEGQVRPMINYLNAGIVGAFRRNQSRHQLLSRNAATQESLAFSGPYGQGAIRGFKANRLSAANTPITPNRKQNFSSILPLSKALLQESPPKKRKFAGDIFTHKRSRASF